MQKNTCSRATAMRRGRARVLCHPVCGGHVLAHVFKKATRLQTHEQRARAGARRAVPRVRAASCMCAQSDGRAKRV